MQIVAASKLVFSSEQARCPTCGKRVTPFNKAEPFVVDDDGRIFCTTHGREEEPRYGKVWTAFWAELKKRREAQAIAAST